MLGNWWIRMRAWLLIVRCKRLRRELLLRGCAAEIRTWEALLG